MPAERTLLLAVQRALRLLLVTAEYAGAAVLTLDVVVVFASVIWRYFLHDPVDWAEEMARALMGALVFLGAATAVGRVAAHGRRQPARIVSRALAAGACPALSLDRRRQSLLRCCCRRGRCWPSRELQTTPIGLPQSIYVWPMVVGSLLMLLFAAAAALAGPWRTVWGTFMAALVLALAAWGWNTMAPEHIVPPALLLAAGFVASFVIGVPIAFVLAFCALLFFLADPSLPMLVYSQQVLSGTDHFVLLAIPFFVLAGLLMEANGMSSRLIELLVRMFGRLRGGLNLIIITATAFFSGVSGSKLADVAAVGGIVMPAVHRTRQDPNEAAAVLASSAIMAETIPPCINMIILGFVANISIGGLFIAGLVPAAILAVALAAVAMLLRFAHRSRARPSNNAGR